MPPCDRPVDVLMPLALPDPETFLIELFKFVLPAVFKITLFTCFVMLLTPWFISFCSLALITVFYECSESCFYVSELPIE